MEIQDQGILLAISLIGVKYGVFDYLYDNPSTEDEIIESLKFDSSYIKKWIMAAEGYRLLVRRNGLLMLSESGKYYSEKSSNSKIANLIQSVFSVLMAHEIIPCLETGVQPGYEVIDKFKNIKPWFDYTNGKKNLPIVDEILRTPVVADFLSNVRGNVADFSCGNGWFLCQINRLLDTPHLYGVTDSHDIVEDVLQVSHSEFFGSDIRFDLIVLNKVLHHIWEDEDLLTKLVSKLTDIGRMFVWEFNWDSVRQNVEKHKEVAFLNFVEHIQGAEFLPTGLVVNRFKKLGLSSRVINIDDGNQIIYLLSK